MSLESFFGLEEGESQGSGEAAEKFREQMQQNAKAIKAMGQHQVKQKQKEDDLARILIAYLRDSSKGDIVFLIIRLLEQNVPGAFILAVLMISDPKLEEELKVSLKEKKAHETMMTSFAGVATLPENVKAELNAWGDEILKAGLLRPNKTLESVLTSENKLKSLVLDLIDFALDEYFTRVGLEFSDDTLTQFGLLSIQSVLVQLREVAANQSDIAIIETPLDA
ncbi:MAG: hypothetical protein AAB802_01700 [Patescibacteria group bacterium]